MSGPAQRIIEVVRFGFLYAFFLGTLGYMDGDTSFRFGSFGEIGATEEHPCSSLNVARIAPWI